MSEYEQNIKTTLSKLGRGTTWLADEVKKETGLYCDRAYLSKIFNGKRNAPRIVAAIDIVLKREALT